MKVHVIVGTTRTGRVTDRAATWVAKTIEADGQAAVEIVDLADYPLEFFHEAIAPQYNPDRQPDAAAKKWLDKVAEADAYVVVTPEYNRSIPAVLKNALDYLAFEFAKKPVLVVSHGSTGGAQAYASLKQILPAVQAIIVPNSVYLNGMLGQLISEAGELDETVAANPYGPKAALAKGLGDLYWYSNALSAARTA